MPPSFEDKITCPFQIDFITLKFIKEWSNDEKNLRRNRRKSSKLYTFKPKLEKSSYASFSRSISSRSSGKLSLKASQAMKQAKSDAMKDCT